MILDYRSCGQRRMTNCFVVFEEILFRSHDIDITVDENIVIQSNLRQKMSLRTKELSNMRGD